MTEQQASGWRSGTSNAFVAQYHGVCGTCDYDIERGQAVRYQDDVLVHVDCGDAQVETVQRVCTICHLTACDCDREKP